MTVPRPRLPFARYPDVIEEQARALRDDLGGADLSVPVPTCPGWNLAQLTVHVGEELRWLETTVRTRATTMLDDTAMRVLDPVPARDPAATGEWVVEGATALAAALRAAGPDAAVWCPVPGATGTRFYARRFAHEGALHRADADGALGRPFTMPREVALDALAEWMELGALPAMLEFHPHRRALFGPGRVLRWQATDVGDDPDATWLVDLAGPELDHRPDPDPARPATVTVRGPVLDLLLVLYRRRPPDTVTVEGDRGLLDEWLAGNAFA